MIYFAPKIILKDTYKKRTFIGIQHGNIHQWYFLYQCIEYNKIYDIKFLYLKLRQVIWSVICTVYIVSNIYIKYI